MLVTAGSPPMTGMAFAVLCFLTANTHHLNAGALGEATLSATVLVPSKPISAGLGSSKLMRVIPVQ